MAKPFIIKRQVKESALTFTELDDNFQNLRDATISIAVDGGLTVVNDLNDTTTLIEADAISIVADPVLKTLSFDASLALDTTPELSATLIANNYDIDDVASVQFNATVEQDHVSNTIWWDPVDGTLAIGMEYDEVVQKVGLNTFYHVKNQTGSTIAKGTVVMAVGTVGASGQILCAPAQGDGSVNARYILGVTNMEIADGGDGYAVQFGLIKGVATDAYSEGTVLWLDPTTPGAFTATEPTAPNLKIALAYVIYAAENGSMFVRSNTGYRLADLHDIDVAGAVTGSTLSYNATSDVWQLANKFYSNGNLSGNLKPDPTLGRVQTVTWTGSASVDDMSGSAVAGDQVKLICTVGSVLTPMTFTTTMLVPTNGQNNYYQTNPTKSWSFDAGDKFVLEMTYDGTNYWCEIHTIYL